MHKLNSIAKFSKWGICRRNDGLGFQKSKLHPGLERVGVTPLEKMELHLLTSCLNFKRYVLSPKCQEHLRTVCHHERLVPVLLRKRRPHVPAAGLQWGFLRRAIKRRGRRMSLFFAQPAVLGEDRTEPTVCSFCWCKISLETRDLFGATLILVVQKMHSEAFIWRENDGSEQLTARKEVREENLRSWRWLLIQSVSLWNCSFSPHQLQEAANPNACVLVSCGAASGVEMKLPARNLPGASSFSEAFSFINTPSSYQFSWLYFLYL